MKYLTDYEVYCLRTGHWIWSERDFWRMVEERFGITDKRIPAELSEDIEGMCKSVIMLWHYRTATSAWDKVSPMAWREDQIERAVRY